MTRPEQTPALDAGTRTAINALRGIIAQRYPSAGFDIVRGEDPEGVYLRTTVDIEDVDEVLDLVLDPLFTYQVEQGLPIYVLPLQPLERVLSEAQRPRPRKRLRLELEKPTSAHQP